MSVINHGSEQAQPVLQRSFTSVLGWIIKFNSSFLLPQPRKASVLPHPLILDSLMWLILTNQEMWTKACNVQLRFASVFLPKKNMQEGYHWAWTSVAGIYPCIYPALSSWRNPEVLAAHGAESPCSSCISAAWSIAPAPGTLCNTKHGAVCYTALLDSWLITRCQLSFQLFKWVVFTLLGEESKAYQS